ncbi:MAG: hypothetical protein AB1611_07465 [bacterium]
MTTQKEKELLQKEIDSLNEEIRALGYKLGGLLNVDCSFGSCTFDPEADSIQEKLQEVQEKRALLERLRENIDSCLTT